MKTRGGYALWLDLGVYRTQPERKRATGPRKIEVAHVVKGRGALPGLREPLPGTKKGVKAGPEAKLEDTGLELSSFG